MDSDDPFSELNVDYFWDSTHPSALDFKHSSWDAFAQDLNKACFSIFPQNPPQYTGVHALLLNWADDDLGTDEELIGFHAQLKEQFDFTAEIWKIPSKEAEYELDRKIVDVRAAHGGENKLLIVYYGGHGKYDRNGRSIWQAWLNEPGKPKSPTLDWHSIQPMLKRAPCDVLILLDCCFAACAARGDIKGTNELLAACGREVEAEGVSDRSFTKNLMRKLRSFGSQPFTVSQLYERLIKDRKRLVNTPVYYPMTGRNKPSISIAPLPTKNLATPLMPTSIALASPSLSEAHSSATDLSHGSTSPPASSQPSSEPTSPRVLLAVSLKEGSSIPDLDQWTEWLRSEAPCDIKHINVKVEAAYLSNSTLMLVSIPVSIWSHLPDSSAYRFIDFVTSDNLWKHSTPLSSEKKLRDCNRELSNLSDKLDECVEDWCEGVSPADSTGSSSLNPRGATYILPCPGVHPISYSNLRILIENSLRKTGLEVRTCCSLS
jgi:hypothetical protein